MAFSVDVNTLQSLIDPKNLPLLAELGGLDGLLRLLRTDRNQGLSTTEEFPEDQQAASTTIAINGDGAGLLRSTTAFPGQHQHQHQQEPFAARVLAFGRNKLPPVPQKNILVYMWEALQDKTLIMLLIASAVSLAVGIYEDTRPDNTEPHWIEAVAIFGAVLVVVLVNSINDFNKEKQFRKLNATKEDRLVNVIRDGQKTQVHIDRIVVGDICPLETGDVVPVDGVLIASSNLKCDESGATGESDTIRKTHEKDPFLISGSKIVEGVGSMVVVAVGVHSFNGKLMLGLRTESEETPLQMKLELLAERIAKLGLAAAILMLITLMTIFLIKTSLIRTADPPRDQSFPDYEKSFQELGAAGIVTRIVSIVIQAITIVVVAVPEGLPMAVTIALAYATNKMLKDNNLVRVLAACETMGGATAICSDKTGTLTMNKMTVVQGRIGKKQFFSEDEVKTLKNARANNDSADGMNGTAGISEVEMDNLALAMACNSSAFEKPNDDGSTTFVGSKTEVALLEFIREVGYDYSTLRKQAEVVHLIPFSSERKRMTTFVQQRDKDAAPTTVRMYVKGASEIVLSMCVMPDAERKEIEHLIMDYAGQALRTLVLGYRDFTMEQFQALDLSREIQENSLNFQCVVGIMDPLRKEVTDSVKICQKAGIFVRMVTGDNITTAKAIASKCGILTKGGLALEGPKFRLLSESDMDRIIPRLQVLARSSPLDKQILVRRLKAMGETVAVTGDGTNDGPALKMADVGFSMGIAGTEVAKEASAIVLMDDNFSSIVKAVMWGRAIYDSVRKFLQFQLTVNLTAVILAFISACQDNSSVSVLTAVQLLWVNLIMDTLAALALATEPPNPELLNRHPHTKREPLISLNMWKMVVGQAMFQIAVNLALVFGWQNFGFTSNDSMRVFVFNTFVFMQLFNEINCRRLDNNINVFKNFFNNYYFHGVIIFTAAAQALIVNFGGKAFSINEPLSASQWLASLLVASLSLPIGAVLRLIPLFSNAENENLHKTITKERLMWDSAISTVRTQIGVYAALRRSKRPLDDSLNDGDDGPAHHHYFVALPQDEDAVPGPDYSGVTSGLAPPKSAGRRTSFASLVHQSLVSRSKSST